MLYFQIYYKPGLFAYFKEVIADKLNACSLLMLHDRDHSAKVESTFVEAYLTVRVHFWCKQMRQQQQLDSRTKRADGQHKRGFTSISHQKKLKKLNITI